MINFQEIDKNRFRNIHNLAVNPGQEAYVTADVEKFVHGWKDAADFDCFVITSGGRQVGFFAVDYNHQRHSAYVPEDRAQPSFAASSLTGAIKSKASRGKRSRT